MTTTTIQIENPENKNMHYGNHPIGRVTPPDYFPKYRLYSYAEGEKTYADMQHDLYMGAKKVKPKKKKGFPAIIKYTIALILAIPVAIGLKSGITKIINYIKR